MDITLAVTGCGTGTASISNINPDCNYIVVYDGNYNDLYSGPITGIPSPLNVSVPADVCSGEFTVSGQAYDEPNYNFEDYGGANADLWQGCRPANDLEANAQAISGSNGSVNGSTQYASSSNYYGGGDVWYSFTAPKSARYIFTVSGVDTFLRFNSGWNPGYGDVSHRGNAYDADPYEKRKVSVTLNQGEIVKIQVLTFPSYAGTTATECGWEDFTLTWEEKFGATIFWTGTPDTYGERLNGFRKIGNELVDCGPRSSGFGLNFSPNARYLVSVNKNNYSNGVSVYDLITGQTLHSAEISSTYYQTLEVISTATNHFWIWGGAVNGLGTLRKFGYDAVEIESTPNVPQPPYDTVGQSVPNRTLCAGNGYVRLVDGDFNELQINYYANVPDGSNFGPTRLNGAATRAILAEATSGVGDTGLFLRVFDFPSETVSSRAKGVDGIEKRFTSEHGGPNNKTSVCLNSDGTVAYVHESLSENGDYVHRIHRIPVSINGNCQISHTFEFRSSTNNRFYQIGYNPTDGNLWAVWVRVGGSNGFSNFTVFDGANLTILNEYGGKSGTYDYQTNQSGFNLYPTGSLNGYPKLLAFLPVPVSYDGSNPPCATVTMNVSAPTWISSIQKWRYEISATVEGEITNPTGSNTLAFGGAATGSHFFGGTGTSWTLPADTLDLSPLTSATVTATMTAPGCTADGTETFSSPAVPSATGTDSATGTGTGTTNSQTTDSLTTDSQTTDFQNSFGGDGYYCLAVANGGETCEFVTQAQYDGIPAYYDQSILSGPHADCVPCYGSGTGTVTDRGTGTPGTGIDTGTGSFGTTDAATTYASTGSDTGTGSLGTTGGTTDQTTDQTATETGTPGTNSSGTGTGSFGTTDAATETGTPGPNTSGTGTGSFGTTDGATDGATDTGTGTETGTPGTGSDTGTGSLGTTDAATTDANTQTGTGTGTSTGTGEPSPPCPSPTPGAVNGLNWTLQIPAPGDAPGDQLYQIVWGDGQSDEWAPDGAATNRVHAYAAPGTYPVLFRVWRGQRDATGEPVYFCPTLFSATVTRPVEPPPPGTRYYCINGVCVPSTEFIEGAPAYASLQICQASCGGGDEDCLDCPDCPDVEGPLPPDPVVCAPTLTWLSPDADALVRSFALVRLQISDANEVLDPCHRNFSRPCNEGGPQLSLKLGDYALPPQAWKLLSGTPLNGVWETQLDAHDYGLGARELAATARGVGCCLARAAREITLAGTLQHGIVYRDILRAAPTGFEVYTISYGVETRALEEETARRYWMQQGARSGTALDGTYQHSDWPSHQPFLLQLGEQFEASGKRFERHNFSAMVTLRLPLARHVRVRQKWTPQYWLGAFPTGCQTIAKIREIAPGKHLVFGRLPSKVFFYENDVLTLKVDLGTLDAATATDVCAVEDKIYVIVPIPDTNQNEVFAVDLDLGQLPVNSGIRRATGQCQFLEAVGGQPLALYLSDDPSDATPTRAYNLDFPSPKPIWTLENRVTKTAVAGPKLLLAIDFELWISADGITAPLLDFEFGDTISALSERFVGLENGEVWKKLSTGWEKVLTRTGTANGSAAIGGVESWLAGTDGELSGEDLRGMAGGPDAVLSGERGNGSWFQERTLLVPPDLAPATVVGVSALERYSVGIAAPPLPEGQTPTQAAEPTRDERMLIGTGQSGLFFVYQRSALSEKQGAVAVSHMILPRLTAFYRRPVIKVAATGE